MGVFLQILCPLLLTLWSHPSPSEALPPYLTDFQSLYPEDFNSFIRGPSKRHFQFEHERPTAEDLARYYNSFNDRENPRHEGDLLAQLGQLNPDFSNLDARAEYADSNFLKSLNGEQMRVTGGNGAMGAYNKYPVSVVPGHTEKVSPPSNHVMQSVYNAHNSLDQSDSSNPIMDEIDQQLEATMGEGSGNDEGVGSSEGASASAMNPYPTPPNPCPLPYPDEEGNSKRFALADGCIPNWKDEADLSRWFQEQQVGKSDSEHNQGVDKGHVKKSMESAHGISHQLPHYLKAEEKRDSISVKKG